MAESFVLPASKLAPVRLRRPVVDRPRLVHNLQEGIARRLVIVTAEAGYGKTCLLVSGLAHLDRPVAWLTLDEADTDPNLFGAGVVLALRQVAPGVGQAALEVLTTGPSQDIYHQLFGEFLQECLARSQPTLVVELHRRAGRHLEMEGAGDQAVRHYLLAGAYAEAVRTLLPYRAARLTAQRAYLFRDLVRRLPKTVADDQPWLLRTAASSCRFIGDYEQALIWSRQAMAAAEGRDADLWAHAVHGVVVMLLSMGRLTEAMFHAVFEGIVTRLA